MTITTRFARLADAQAIVALAHITWKATYSTIYPMAYIETCLANWYNLEAVTRGCSQQRKEWHGYLLAEREGQLIGYLGAGVTEDVGVIYNFYVLPEHQGQGIGQLLLETMTAFQVNQYGIRSQRLEVAKDNQSALSFYRHHGFEPYGEEEKEFAGQAIYQTLCQRRIG